MEYLYRLTMVLFWYIPIELSYKVGWIIHNLGGWIIIRTQHKRLTNDH